MAYHLEELYQLLKSPPAEYRTAPLWVWNDWMTNEQIDKALDELKSHGFGGAVAHPRPGMRISYMTEQYFAQWRYALEGAKKRGLQLIIYDENSYPSGFGGGLVSAELPDCLSQSVAYKVFTKKDLTDKQTVGFLGNSGLVRIFLCDQPVGNTLRIKKDITLLDTSEWGTLGEWFLAFAILPARTERWMAGFSNVNLLRPEVTEKFIELIYEPYYKHFGEEFGNTIPAIFTDEPAVTGSVIYNKDSGNQIPYCFWFAQKFYEHNGYRLEDYLPCLFFDTEGLDKPCETVRYDYYSTVQKLWLQSFVKPLHHWCQEHHVALTGHFMEDEWPMPVGQTLSPDPMGNYEFMGWPGIDMLVNDKLLNDPHEYVGFIRWQLRSVVNQIGKTRTFCEAFGAGGWDSGLQDFKRVGDWLLVGGINFINEHLTYTSTLGARKRDHPQSFDWRQPWWEEFVPLNHYWGRACAVLSQGEMRQRILLLHPTTTGYLIRHAGECVNMVVNKTIPDKPDMREYHAFTQILSDAQWDFDLGNEDVLQTHGMPKNGKLQVGRQCYELVLVTQDMKNFNESTMELLERYLDAGGCVLSLGQPGPYVNGVASKSRFSNLAARSGWQQYENAAALIKAIETKIPRRFTAVPSFPSGVEHMYRELDDTHGLYYFVNHSHQEVVSTLTLRGNGVQYLDLFTGERKAFIVKNEGETAQLELRLAHNESALLLAGDIGGTSAQVYHRTGIEGMVPVAVEAGAIRPDRVNSFPIEYCDLFVDGHTFRDMNCIKAGIELYRHRGYDANPWDNEVQYKTRYYDSNCYGIGSGFAVEYHFQVADIPESAALVIERGDRYRVLVNGEQATGEKTDFLDEQNISYRLNGRLHTGQNTMRIETDIFDVEMEIEAVYLRGDFSVMENDGVWQITKPKSLHLGNWVPQGYPFFEGAVEYSYRFHCPAGGTAVVVVPENESTALSLTVNAEQVGTVCLNGNNPIDISQYCREDNQLVLRVTGGMRNLLGPHHAAEATRKNAWPATWKEAPVFGRPKAAADQLCAYGLWAPLRIFTNQ